MSGFYSKYGFDDFNYLLSKVIPQETYRGYQLRQIGINTYQFGIKTGTKEEIKKFIDQIRSWIDGCELCENNKDGVEAGMWCINNCINGSKFKQRQ